jgi:hypothetical protein
MSVAIPEMEGARSINMRNVFIFFAGSKDDYVIDDSLKVSPTNGNGHVKMNLF